MFRVGNRFLVAVNVFYIWHKYNSERNSLAKRLYIDCNVCNVSQDNNKLKIPVKINKRSCSLIMID